MKPKRTSNIQRPTSNIEPMRQRGLRRSILDVQCSMFDVRLNFPRSFPRAFSFAEVMFAVVILGIGFIMVAAVFPVAIRQTQSSGEENTAAAAARTAAAAISSLPTTLTNPWRNGATTPYTGAAIPATVPVFPPTIKNYWLGNGMTTPTLPAGATVVPPPAVVVPFIGIRGNLLNANIIQNTDPRYSYVAFYKRENNSTAAELIVIAVANRNRPMYDTTDLPNTNTQSVANANLVPQLAAALQPQLTTIYPDSITLTGATTSVVEGCTASFTATPIISAQPPYPPVVRTFAFGRPFGGGYFELNPADGITLAPNTQTGLWGDISYTPPSTTNTAYVDKRIKDTDPPGTASAAAVFAPVSNLQPTVAYVQSLTATAANPTGQITLSAGPNYGSPFPPLAAVTGAFVIIADDCPFDPTGTNPNTTANYSLPPNTAKYQVGKLNGRIFRLGNQVVQSATGIAQSGTFLLDPAYGMRPGVPDASITPFPPNTANTIYGPDSFPSPYMPNPSSGFVPFGQTTQGLPQITARCYIIGAGKDPSNANNKTGPAQDLGAFATYFQVQ